MGLPNIFWYYIYIRPQKILILKNIKSFLRDEKEINIFNENFLNLPICYLPASIVSI